MRSKSTGTSGATCRLDRRNSTRALKPAAIKHTTETHQREAIKSKPKIDKPKAGATSIPAHQSKGRVLRVPVGKKRAPSTNTADTGTVIQKIQRQLPNSRIKAPMEGANTAVMETVMALRLKPIPNNRNG